MPANFAPKEVPTLRDSGDPEQLDMFQRELREIIRRLTLKVSELQDRVAALENP